MYGFSCLFIGFVRVVIYGLWMKGDKRRCLQLDSIMQPSVMKW